MYNRLWLYRDNATSSDWLTARLHDGISIDATYATPQLNTRTWWERDPFDNIQSWGTAADTYLTINKGNVGIGTIDPNAKLEIVGNDPDNLEIAGFYNARVYGDANDKSETRINIGKLEGIIRQPMGAIGAFPSSNTSSQYGNLAFYTRENQAVIERVRINSNGNVGIGTTAPDSKLAVNGTIHSKEVKVDMVGWPDYVFKKAYDLPTLEEVEKHINEKGHLENIPSEEEVLKNGINLGEMNAKLLQKMEEMTLYIIEEHKTNEKLIKIIEEQNKRLEVLEKKE